MVLICDEIRAIAKELDDVIDCYAAYACETLAKRLEEIAETIEDWELEAMEEYD